MGEGARRAGEGSYHLARRAWPDARSLATRSIVTLEHWARALIRPSAPFSHAYRAGEGESPVAVCSRLLDGGYRLARGLHVAPEARLIDIVLGDGRARDLEIGTPAFGGEN